MAAEIHEGDVGTAFKITVKDEDDVVIDISSATLKQIWFQKADGSVSTKTATLVTDGTDGQMQYITVDDDLDQTGKWKIQGYIEIGSSRKVHTDVSEFKVWANLQ